jgi:rare lipoprotein A
MFISMRRLLQKATYTLCALFFYALTTFCLLAEDGHASHYSVACNSAGKHSSLGSTVTASGLPLNDKDMTAAHKTLPFGTKVRVTRVDTGRSVVVVITDRGPYKKGRIIDLARGAARKLGIMRIGVVKVSAEVVHS